MVGGTRWKLQEKLIWDKRGEQILFINSEQFAHWISFLPACSSSLLRILICQSTFSTLITAGDDQENLLFCTPRDQFPIGLSPKLMSSLDEEWHPISNIFYLLQTSYNIDLIRVLKSMFKITSY